MAEISESDDDAPPFELGNKLHQVVPPECWGVTREDLKKLKLEVCEALESSQLRPNDQDQFDPSDRRIGPSMYTIVAYYIKPLTASHGGMSWALMNHPKGLKCDIFVTHGWSEGVFELIDKVLNSWPSSGNHAYICALANPQNLDISGLISCPSRSPFARALRASSYVLVVPNRKVSIYSRVWCVYEAFLGYSLEKVILVCRRPRGNRSVRLVVELLPSFLVGVIAGLVKPLALRESLILWLVVYLSTSLVVVLEANRFKRCVNHLAVMVVSYLAAVRLKPCSCFVNRQTDGYGLYPYYSAYKTFLHCVLYYVGLLFALACGALDIAEREEAKFESDELTHGFSGDVRDAQCSNPADSKTIFEEIWSQIDDVNHAIGVLQDAGMSTSELRLLARNGFRVQHAGYINFSLTSMGFLTWFHGINYHTYHKSRFTKRQLLVLLSCVGWSVVWLLSERDRRAFASAAVGRILYLTDVTYYALDLCIFGFEAGYYAGNEALHGYAMATAGLITLFISVAGPARVIRIPFVGRLIVRYLMTKRLYKCCILLCKREHQNTVTNVERADRMRSIIPTSGSFTEVELAQRRRTTLLISEPGSSTSSLHFAPQML